MNNANHCSTMIKSAGFEWLRVEIAQSPLGYPTVVTDENGRQMDHASPASYIFNIFIWSWVFLACFVLVHSLDD